MKKSNHLKEKTMVKEVIIKGVKYKIKFLNDVFVLNDSVVDATCDYLNKIITINKNAMDIDKVIRHELTHAFFNECNLPSYSNDETLVNWIAYAIPDIENSLKEIKKIGGDKNE